MEPQRPENNAIIELALERIDRIAETNIVGIDIVRNILREQGWQICLQGLGELLDL